MWGGGVSNEALWSSKKMLCSQRSGQTRRTWGERGSRGHPVKEMQGFWRGGGGACNLPGNILPKQVFETVDYSKNDLKVGTFGIIWILHNHLLHFSLPSRAKPSVLKGSKADGFVVAPETLLNS
ncbi:UNVERIFIED_CONTAM: hypothetical protein K2H54_066819 [Gekko kuhli]